MAQEISGYRSKIKWAILVFFILVTVLYLNPLVIINAGDRGGVITLSAR